MNQNSKVKKIKRFIYLKEIFFLAISAFGGPQVHFAMILKRLVNEKKYLAEEELLELNSLCQILPGPTSTQTLTAIGFKLGGPSLAFLTLIIWITPATILMTLFSLGIGYLGKQEINMDFLKYLYPLAVSFIIAAAVKMTRIVKKNKVNIFLVIFSVFTASIVPNPFIFPIILILGGVVSANFNKDFIPNDKPVVNVKWGNFILFLGIFIGAAVLGGLTKAKPVLLFENNYRFGSLVFGGGHVLIPMMYEQFVKFKSYIPREEFITGVSLLQVVPGPVFSFSTYTGGLVLRDWGIGGQILGCFIGTAGIFLPGILLIFFIYPLWDQLKTYPIIQRSLSGINAAAVGLVISAAYLFIRPIGIEPINFFIIGSSITLLLYTKVPAPLLVGIALFAGLIF